MSCSLCLLCNATAHGERFFFRARSARLTPLGAPVTTLCREQGRVPMRRSQPASEDSEDADTVATADCSRWRNGVERQARPDAHAHQVAAGKASGAKRKQHAMTKDQRDARRNEGKRLRREQGRTAQAQAQAEQPAAKQDTLRPDVSWHCCSRNDSLQPEHPLRLEYEALLRGDLLAAVEHRIHYIEVSSLGNYIAPEDAAALRELAAVGK